MAKELSLEQVEGNGGTVQLDQRPAAAGVGIVDRLSDEFFAVPVSPWMSTVESAGAIVGLGLASRASLRSGSAMTPNSAPFLPRPNLPGSPVLH